MPTPTDWSLVSEKMLRGVHKAAHKAYRHRSGCHLVLVYYGFGTCNPTTYSWWLLPHKVKGRYREHASSPDNPPFGWATSLLTAVP